MSNKSLTFGLIVVGIIAIVGVFSPVAQKAINGLGAAVSCQVTTCLEGGLRITTGVLEADGGLQIGTAGTSMTQILSGVGPLIYSDPSVVASTTRAFDIAVTGVVSTDRVMVQAATTTAASLGWDIVGAAASTTSGYITVQIANGTGATAVVPRNIASSTAYLIIR